LNVSECALKRLLRIPGVIDCRAVPHEERVALIQLEDDSNLRLGLPGLEIANEGIKEVLKRQHVVAILHSPALRHPPEPIIVVYDGDRVVGEEVRDTAVLRKLSADSDVILLGNLAFNRKQLETAKGKPLKLVYKALRFPELEQLEGIRDVASVTIGIPAHLRLAKRFGWNPDDPQLGTVLIGFNETRS